MWFVRLMRSAALVLLTVLVAGIIGASMVRFGPGFGVEEEQLDIRLQAATVDALRNAHASEENVPRFYLRFLAGALQGDFGISHSLQRPVAGLLRERLPVTLRLVAIGLAGGWFLGLLLAAPASFSRMPVWDLLATIFSGLFQCIPSAVLALLLFLFRGPVDIAVGLIVFPKIFRYTRNLLKDTCGHPHVLTARARGIGPSRIFLRHIVPAIAPQMLALAGVSASLAFAA